jgi:phosphate starvation-inducible PhoH-like protein
MNWWLLFVSMCSFSSKIGGVSYRAISMKIKKSRVESYIPSLLKYKPRKENQIKYVEHLTNSNVSVVGGFGPAGSGKTLFACHAAVCSLKSGLVDKIVITRPLISVDDEELGFLPGSIVHKMDPWTRPIFDILGEFYSLNQIHSMVQTGVIEISPLAYMRGRTFKKSFIIADEMQNSSPNQMLMMLTRIGEDSKLVITGDLKQSDRSGVNGLLDFIQKLRTSNENSLIKFVELESVDIQRSPVVSRILDIYDSKKNAVDSDAAIIPKGYDAKSFIL